MSAGRAAASVRHRAGVRAPTATPRHPDDLPLTGREGLVVVAFWLTWAALSAANRVLDPFGPAQAGGPTWRPFAVVGAEAVCWIALTPPLFRLAARAGADRVTLPARVAVLGGAGVLVALTVAVAGA